MHKHIIIPCDFKERNTVEVVQGLSVIPGAPLYGIKDNRRVNFNSLLGVLSLNIKRGDDIIFESDDNKKIEKIEYLLQSMR